MSQDPIGLDGGFELYSYVHDANSWPQETWDKFGSKTRGGMDFYEVGFKGKHSAANGIYLPNNEALARKLGCSYFHPGSHPNFNVHVEKRIQVIADQYKIHKNKARAKGDLEKC